MMSTNTPSERASTGAARFDKLEPGWAEKINIETLDVSSEFTCPVAQLAGNFNDAPMALKSEPVRHGLIAKSYEEGEPVVRLRRGVGIKDSLTPEQKEEYRELTEAWTDEVLKRRQEQQQSLPIAA